MIALALWLSASSPDALADLALRLPARAALHCTFRQSKRSALFRQALASTGELWVLRPGKLRFEIKAPDASLFIVDGARAYVSTNVSADGSADVSGRGETRELALEKLPTAHHFLAAFTELFGGDLAALRRIFSVELQAPRHLFLTPKDGTQLVRNVELFFAGSPLALHEVRVLESSGDSTTLLLERCDERLGDPEERFRIP